VRLRRLWDAISLTGGPGADAGAGPGIGVYLGWGTLGPVRARPDEHVLVLGPPRSGKTTRLVAPALLSHPGPAVVTSTKPDIFVMTTQQRSRLGPLWCWSPAGPVPDGAHQLRWSPLSGCADWDVAVARAHTLASAARPGAGGHDWHWVERAQALLAPLLHAAALEGTDVGALMSWLHRRDLVVPLSVLTGAGASLAADVLAGVAQTDPRELSGIFSTADGVLAAYRSQAALQAARQPNFDAEELVERGGTVYICAPSSAQALFAPLVVALLDHVRTATYRAQPYPPVLFALDELANIAPLPDLATTLAEGGSQGLVVMGCLQDLSQARQRWGPAADGFLTLFANKLLLPAIADTATLKAVSTLAGEVEVELASQSYQGGLLRRQRSVTWSTRRQPRLSEADIAGGAPGTALLVRGARFSRVHLPGAL
jgi:type IV secretory pathway TraG/TraD family ATPase VirD4